IGEAERQQVRDHAGTVEREFSALNMLQATLPAHQITPLVTAANGGADPWITMLGEDAALPTPPYQTETRSLTEAGAATGSGMPWTVAQADRTVQNTQQLSVAVLDTGLDSSHAALTDRIVSQYDAVTGSQNQAADRDGHGSHVAGIIAGVSAADGFAGVAAGIDLVNVRIGGDGVWRTSNIVDGIDWLIRHKTDQHTVVINNSNTYVGRNNPFWTVALRTATEAGLVVVTAAGDGFDEGASIGAPAGVAQAVTVGAANSKRQVTYYSSRGQADKDVIKPDVLAPADNIRSVQAAGQTSGGSYQFQSGTSTATPFVTGMAALLVDRLTDAIRGVADNDARIDEDGWDGIDNDGDNLIDEDPGPWGYSAAEVRLVKSLILMTTAQAL
ncbi:MAG: S8 family serine peptidase, partial [Caldilineaceae bacterium]|nr:S8 family serine peptidase [Caldilineaceae bacterium]